MTTSYPYSKGLESTHYKPTKPQYSALFLNSQWKPSLSSQEPDNNWDHMGRQRVYATQSGSVPARGHLRVTVQVEGMIKQSQYLFTPYFDQDIQDLVQIESRNPWAAGLTLVNHTDQPREWQRGSFLGYLEGVEKCVNTNPYLHRGPFIWKGES